MSETQDSQNTTSDLKDKTLKIAGAGYTVGDLAMAQAAHLRGEKDVFDGALIWLAGGIAAARYGNPSGDRQLSMFSQKLEAHLKEQGIEIPDDTRQQNALLKKPDFIARCENFLYQHPSEMLNAAYAIGAALLLKNGVKELSSGKKQFMPKLEGGLNVSSAIAWANNISKNFWMGALVGGGALSGLFIKEDPNAREHAKGKGFFARMGAYIQEKPLRLTGTLYGANNIFTVLKALEDHSHRGQYTTAMKPHHFSGITAATYILSNILLTSVSRDSSGKGFTPAQINKLEEAAALMIAAQPPEKQQQLFTEVAEFMAHQKSVPLSAAEIETQLAARVRTLSSPATEAPATQFAAKETARRQTPAQAVLSV